MVAMTFDTLSTSRRLREKGFKQEQAEAIADEMRIASSVDISHLATKEEMQTFKSELKEDLQKFATKHDIEKIELRVTIKLGSLIIAGVAFLAAIKFFG